MGHDLFYSLGSFKDNGMVHVPDAAGRIVKGDCLDPLDVGRVASRGKEWGGHVDLLAPKAQIEDDPSLAVVDEQGKGHARHVRFPGGQAECSPVA
jgi:hypothetical protein